MNNLELIEALREHARKTGMSQETLAARIGVRLCTVNRWFKGKTIKMHEASARSIRQYFSKIKDVKNA